MSRRISLALVIAVVALTGGTTAGAAPSGVPAGTFTGCPHALRPLPPRPTEHQAAAEQAVLHFVATGFLPYAHEPGSRLAHARVEQALPVRRWLPSGWIKEECGLAVWQRSVAVVVYFPKLDKPHNPVGRCNACARLVFIAARTSAGWIVWARY